MNPLYKKIIFTTGLLLVILSGISIVQHILNFDLTGQYGKGFLAGKAILLTTGIILIFFSRKKSALSTSVEKD